MSSADVTFRAMGSEIRMIVGPPGPAGIDPIDAVAEAKAFIEEFEQCLSRFRTDSELCALNARAGEDTSASAVLLRAVEAVNLPPHTLIGWDQATAAELPNS